MSARMREIVDNILENLDPNLTFFRGRDFDVFNREGFA